MKSSKFTQVSSPAENGYGVYPTAPAAQEANLHPQVGRPNYAEVHIVNASEEHLLNSGFDGFSDQHYDVQPRASPEVQQQQHQDMEMVCSCSSKDMMLKKPPWDHYNSEQNIAFARNYPSLQRLSNAGSQFSLDRKHVPRKVPGKVHHVSYNCDSKTMQKLERNASLKRMQSPEIINIHRGPTIVYDGCVADSCPGQKYGCEKEIKCDEYGFRRGPSFKRTLER